MADHSAAERRSGKSFGERLDRLEDDGFVVVGVCIFLAIIVWLVFGQTLGHEFLNYDDDAYVYQNPYVIAGAYAQRNFVGIHLCGDRPLASRDVVLTHAGLPSLGPPGWRTSSDQCASSCCGRHPSVSRLEANDRRALAERLCRRALCHPSAAGGVGGVDCGAQRCFEWSFLHGDDPRLCALCA